MSNLSNTVKIFLYEIKLGKIKNIYDKLKNHDNINFDNLKKHYFKITDKILYWRFLLKIFKNKEIAFNCFTKKYQINN